MEAALTCISFSFLKKLQSADRLYKRRSVGQVSLVVPNKLNAAYMDAL